MGCGCNSMHGFGAFGGPPGELSATDKAAILQCLATGHTPMVSVNQLKFFGCAPAAKPADLPAGETWLDAGCSCPPATIYNTSSGKCMPGDGPGPGDVAPTGCPMSKTTTYILYGVGALAAGLIVWKMMK